MSQTYFITGASRGIGLGLVREALSASNTSVVIASARSLPSKNLEELQKEFGSDKLHIVPLDVTSETSVEQAYEFITTKIPNFQSIDILINNAGQMATGSSNESLSNPTSSQALLDTYKANVVGPYLISSKFVPLLSKSGKLINISSMLGSLQVLRQYKIVGFHSYSCSKAAVNMLTVEFANELDKINESDASSSKIAVSVHPGHVRTELGGEEAPVSVEESVKGILNVVLSLGKDDNGKFVDYTGAALPW